MRPSVFANVYTEDGFFLGKEVNLFLPKFKIEQELNLAPLLESMGMQDAFSPQKANFHKIRSPQVGGNLFISGVIHKAFIEENEAGTEAAAATGAIMFGATAKMTTPVLFQANRPFLFFLRRASTDSLLFMGKVSKLTP